MVAVTGINRRPIRLTGFMPYTSATKITARLSAFSREKFLPQPMAEKTGLLIPARQQASSEFILPMPTLVPLLATMVRFLERPMVETIGLLKQAEQSTSSEQFGLQTPTQAQ